MQNGPSTNGCGPAKDSKKVFIQRDYSVGTKVKFSTEFPHELMGIVEQHTLEHTIKQLNSMFDEAEKLTGGTYAESCAGCLSGYMLFLCINTRYEKVLNKIERFIAEQNDCIYAHCGLYIVNPAKRGLRVVSRAHITHL